MSSIPELVSCAAQCYGSYKAANELGWITDYNNYVSKLSHKLKMEPTEIENQIRNAARQHSQQLEAHIHYKYGYGEKRKDYPCQRDLLAVSWLKSISKLEHERFEQGLRPINVKDCSDIKSKEMKKILSRGVPETDDEWLEAVCLTDNIDVRDLLRLKFGPLYFPEGFSDKFQFPYSYNLIDVVEDITKMFPELKKYCSNYLPF